jgi:hypothetical protein
MERVNRLERYYVREQKSFEKKVKESTSIRVTYGEERLANGNSRVVFRIFSSGGARLRVV